MLLANNLSFQRERKNIFQNLDISLSPKKIIHLQGRNGIGKTTLIKVLANIFTPTTGNIYWNGKNIKKNFNEYYSNLTLIMDKQSSKKEMTVDENIKFWMRLFSSSIKTKEVEATLNLLELVKYKNIKVGYLSAGEIKKLELCRLVIEKKKLWLLDEPFNNLDEATTNLLNETFKNHIEKQGMIIFSSHFNLELQNMDIIKLENYVYN